MGDVGRMDIVKVEYQLSSLINDVSNMIYFKAKEKNEEYYQEYGRMINKFTKEFIAEYCDNDNNINWDKIVRMNAAIKQPKEKKASTTKKAKK